MIRLKKYRHLYKFVYIDCMGSGFVLRDQKKIFLWVIIGIAVCFVEAFLLSVSSRYELFTETVVLSIVSAVLFWAVNHFKSEIPHYFAKSVVCMWIGRLILYAICFCFENGEGLRIIAAWAVMLTVLLFCMKMIQLVYDRIADKGVYFGYILIGVALTFNAAYMAAEYDNFQTRPGTWWGALQEHLYMLEHGIALLAVIIYVVYHYRKYDRFRIKKNGIAGRTYSYNAIKMTVVSFMLFVFPLYALFLAN